MNGPQILFALVGLAVGSFLNVVIDRVPRGQSLLRPRSRCPACQRELSVLEMIPVLSFAALRGRCRTCGTAIPIRVPLVEGGSGLLFAFMWGFFDDLALRLLASLFGAALIALSVIDIEHQRIPNVLVYPALGLGLVTALTPGLGRWYLHLAGGALAFAVLLAIAVVMRGAMGMGDVKLAAFVGLVVGFPNTLVALFVAFLLGGLIAATLLLAGRVSRRDPIPFGPFLAVGGLTALIAGEALINWWLARA